MCLDPHSGGMDGLFIRTANMTFPKGFSCCCWGGKVGKEKRPLTAFVDLLQFIHRRKREELVTGFAANSQGPAKGHKRSSQAKESHTLPVCHGVQLSALWLPIQIQIHHFSRGHLTFSSFNTQTRDCLCNHNRSNFLKDFFFLAFF